MDIHIPKSMDGHIPSTLVLEPNTPIENELGEIVITGEPEFEEIIEEYEEELLVREEVPEPPPTDSANTAPAQGKPGA